MSDRGDLIVSWWLLVLRAVDAKLCFDLAKRALGAVQRELQLEGLQPHQGIAQSDFGPKLDGHLFDDASDFAADSCLIGRHEGAREIDLPLNRDPLNRRAFDRHGLRLPAAAQKAGDRPASIRP